MKVKKLHLDESMFEDSWTLATDIFGDDTDNMIPSLGGIDDEPFEVVEDPHSIDNVPKGPKEGADTGVAAELISLINDEWEAVQGYNNAIATLRENSAENPFYLDAINVLEEISAEENRHVGQLQELLKQISPNAEEIEKGTQEAKDQLNFVDGKLQVQSWDALKPSSNNNNMMGNEDDNYMISLSDIDDEM